MRHLKIMLKTGTALLVPIAMAGCSDMKDNTGTAPPAPTPTPTATFQSKFGASFVGFFEANNTTDPREPTASDVPALSTTADPIDN